MSDKMIATGLLPDEAFFSSILLRMTADDRELLIAAFKASALAHRVTAFLSMSSEGQSLSLQFVEHLEEVSDLL